MTTVEDLYAKLFRYFSDSTDASSKKWARRIWDLMRAAKIDPMVLKADDALVKLELAYYRNEAGFQVLQYGPKE